MLLLRARGGPADEGGRALQVGIAADAGADQELADLAAQALGVGDDRGQRDVVGHAVERAAERDQRARIVPGGGAGAALRPPARPKEAGRRLLPAGRTSAGHCGRPASGLDVIGWSGHPNCG